MAIAVIGGGIGGLSAALHPLHAGLDVQVYEQALRITEIGAGIQMSPNASRLLIRLGLKAALDAVQASGRSPYISGAGTIRTPAACAARPRDRGYLRRALRLPSTAPTSRTCWRRVCRHGAVSCMSGHKLIEVELNGATA